MKEKKVLIRESRVEKDVTLKNFIVEQVVPLLMRRFVFT